MSRMLFYFHFLIKIMYFVAYPAIHIIYSSFLPATSRALGFPFSSLSSASASNPQAPLIGISWFRFPLPSSFSAFSYWSTISLKLVSAFSSIPFSVSFILSPSLSLFPFSSLFLVIHFCCRFFFFCGNVLISFSLTPNLQTQTKLDYSSFRIFRFLNLIRLDYFWKKWSSMVNIMG